MHHVRGEADALACRSLRQFQSKTFAALPNEEELRYQVWQGLSCIVAALVRQTYPLRRRHMTCKIN